MRSTIPHLFRQQATRFAIPIVAVLATSAAADPVPGYTNRGFVAGANHHVGDAGFRASFGREPKPGEEHARIHEHFVYVQNMLASRAAPRPDLAARRAAMLSYFDDYIRRDITPENRNLPWRAPVFIDDKGTICAVGYLIERSAGRPLADKVAASHKFDYIDDIAAKMPEVKAWAESSGLSLEELASIQPGYVGPLMEQYEVWASQDPERDGDYDEHQLHTRRVGRFVNHDMEGDWHTYTADRSETQDADVEPTIVGSGTLHHGSGAWTSFYDNGKLLAKGAYKHNIPSGAWTLYHPSGNIAAEGHLVRGLRDGRWTFYYDTAARTPIATGRFSHGSMTGAWRHFDEHGKMVARGSQSGVLTIIPGADKVEHDIVEQGRRVDRFAIGSDQLFVLEALSDDAGSQIFDTNGHQLAQVDGHWTERTCKLPRRAVAAARATDITTFGSLMTKSDDLTCSDAQPVADARAAKIDRILHPMLLIRAQTPDFMRALVLDDPTYANAAADDDAAAAAVVVTDHASVNDASAMTLDAAEIAIAAINGDATAPIAPTPTPAKPVRATKRNDLVELIAAHMTSDREWPHIEKPFMALYASLPGVSNQFM